MNLKNSNLPRLGFLSALFFFIALFASRAQAQTYTNTDGTLYTINGDEIAITGYIGTTNELIITNTIGGLPVTSIADSAFYGCTLDSVTIPDTVASIGEGAFEDADSLTNVTIPDSVNNIGFSAFSHCPSLVSIELPDNLTNAQYIFAFSAVANVTFGGSATRIVTYEFAEATGLTNITISDGITRIGDDAFYDCYGLTNVTLLDTVTNIGNNVFLWCTSLTSVTVSPNNPSFKSVGGVLFNQSGTGLIEYPVGLSGSYVVTNNVTSIGAEAFAGSANLTSVMIGNNVTNIGDGAFEDCTSLTNLTLPGSLISIGNESFAACSSLTSVTILNGLIKIGTNAFGYCQSLTNVAIPNSVTSISDEAFYECSSLASVTIGSGVSNIGEFAFGWCSSLTNVLFLGNAPLVDRQSGTNDGFVFYSAGSGMVYFVPGTTGWGSSFGGWYADGWYEPAPMILDSLNGSTNFGVRNKNFGFIVSWATNLCLVVQAATNMANPTWTPVSTNTLTNGAFYFSDSQWTNYPGRFYRISTP